MDEDLREMIESKEHALLVKIDEIKYNQDKIMEKVSRIDDDGSSVAQSARVMATVVAAPITVAAPASSNPSEIDVSIS